MGGHFGRLKYSFGSRTGGQGFKASGQRFEKFDFDSEHVVDFTGVPFCYFARGSSTLPLGALCAGIPVWIYYHPAAPAVT
jgi:hypothetical protein